jgi:hypothetical protein
MLDPNLFYFARFARIIDCWYCANGNIVIGVDKMSDAIIHVMLPFCLFFCSQGFPIRIDARKKKAITRTREWIKENYKIEWL